MEYYEFCDTSAAYKVQLASFSSPDGSDSLPAPVNLAAVDSFSTREADPTATVCQRETDVEQRIGHRPADPERRHFREWVAAHEPR